jgi:CRISPR type III-B/RAMP module-associated protein Cmr5
MQSKSQEYSQKVFEDIEQLVKDKDENALKRYKSLVKRSGGILRSVGLIQYLTFLAAKAAKTSEIHHEFLLNHLSDELNSLEILPAATNRDEFIKTVQGQELPQYMRLTQEVLKLLQWHRRISEILISGTANQEE